VWNGYTAVSTDPVEGGGTDEIRGAVGVAEVAIVDLFFLFDLGGVIEDMGCLVAFVSLYFSSRAQDTLMTGPSAHWTPRLLPMYDEIPVYTIVFSILLYLHG
jgi:hypothetical protein